MASSSQFSFDRGSRGKNRVENGPGHEQATYSPHAPSVNTSESNMTSNGMSRFNPLTPVHTRTEFSSPMLGNPPGISSHLAIVGPPTQKVNIRNGKAQKLHRRGPRHYYASHYYKSSVLAEQMGFSSELMQDPVRTLYPGTLPPMYGGLTMSSSVYPTPPLLGSAIYDDRAARISKPPLKFQTVIVPRNISGEECLSRRIRFEIAGPRANPELWSKGPTVSQLLNNISNPVILVDGNQPVWKTRIINPTQISWVFDWPGLDREHIQVLRCAFGSDPRLSPDPMTLDDLAYEIARFFSKAVKQQRKDRRRFGQTLEEWDDREKYHLQNVDLTKVRLETFDYFKDASLWCPRFSYELPQ